MHSRIILAGLLILLASTAHAQTVAFCERGTLCWTDNSSGQAQTELKFSHQPDGNAEAVRTETVIAEKGVSVFDFVELLRTSKSQWVCVQARTRQDGKVSGWYISDTEGLCKELALVMPGGPVVVPPVTPPPVTPPPVVEPPPTGNPFTNIRSGVWIDPRTKKSHDALFLEWSTSQCKSVSRHQEGRNTKTETLVCKR